MKINSFNYLIRQGFKGIWRNKMMTFASFCILLVSLIMVGFSILVSINLDKIIGNIEEKSEVMVVIKDGVSKSKLSEIEEKIKDIPNVKDVRLYSKDEAWKDMMEKMTEAQQDYFKYAEDNPLPDVYRLNVNDIKKMSETTTEIELFDGVESVQSPTEFANILINFRRIFIIVAIAIVVALVLVSLIIISNTTRASVFARRKEINIMKYVGATNSFIRIPFFIEGMVVGLIAAGCALFITKFAYEGVYKILNEDYHLFGIFGLNNIYSFDSMFIAVTISYLVAGAFIGAIGTSISTGKHLKV
ncbi:MAG: permease-like cell division protein FtsX [Ruminococcus sp.]|nr:permease-like cell division protein FtsX [Ruminococcus sp.]MBR7008857.1 permease-like cell division protein FtsX [Ruminococcus sp.]